MSTKFWANEMSPRRGGENKTMHRYVSRKQHKTLTTLKEPDCAVPSLAWERLDNGAAFLCRSPAAGEVAVYRSLSAATLSAGIYETYNWG